MVVVSGTVVVSATVVVTMVVVSEVVGGSAGTCNTYLAAPASIGSAALPIELQ